MKINPYNNLSENRASIFATTRKTSDKENNDDVEKRQLLNNSVYKRTHASLKRGPAGIQRNKNL
jgi:hypothetical protein